MTHQTGAVQISTFSRERRQPEDLKFLDSHRFAVAFLAQTLVLKGDEVVFNPRHQPLKVLPEIKLIAGTGWDV